ncbi:predicted protein [Sclerotinia sclerotiorum 1980 UF-70]|uniref:SMODS and SLOG-associating 2TM effector domain-containing protein n=2 Tax=Sclerotinia sclerotiorum (strain ATCC 18683 / 1980 / Ss-1) TaxID=665079 RepID=A7EWH0_SCLS1|nr:predicted protein [Sclerotinia sclerotiorum 1980 UF-70]APA05286.1 hypothetical protein sscle_01g000560 [Sclerotinia sclerotiorum 1980 UF-70]EDN93812.1 predicted protein [Sclerotinia sclerotiorum 1980 UF-70]
MFHRNGGAKPQSLETTSNSQIEERSLESSSLLPLKEPFFLTAKFWKRFSVYFSVALSIASLVISSIASLRPTSASDLRALTVTSIVINAISVTLSALTSLDWQSKATTDRNFAQMLDQIGHVHGAEGRVVVLGRERWVEERMVGERVGRDMFELSNR